MRRKLFIPNNFLLLLLIQNSGGLVERRDPLISKQQFFLTNFQLFSSALRDMERVELITRQAELYQVLCSSAFKSHWKSSEREKQLYIHEESKYYTSPP